MLPDGGFDKLVQFAAVDLENLAPVQAKVQRVSGHVPHARIYFPANSSATFVRSAPIHLPTCRACSMST